MKKTIIEVPDDCRECPCVVETRARIGSSERMFWLCRAFNAVLVMEVLKKQERPCACIRAKSARRVESKCTETKKAIRISPLVTRSGRRTGQRRD